MENIYVFKKFKKVFLGFLNARFSGIQSQILIVKSTAGKNLGF